MEGPGQAERKQDQLLPHYLRMNDLLHRFLPLYYHVEPGYLFLVVIIRPRRMDYLLQVVSTLSLHCRLTVQQPLRDVFPAKWIFVHTVSPWVIQDRLLAIFTIMSCSSSLTCLNYII